MAQNPSTNNAGNSIALVIEGVGKLTGQEAITQKILTELGKIEIGSTQLVKWKDLKQSATAIDIMFPLPKCRWVIDKPLGFDYPTTIKLGMIYDYVFDWKEHDLGFGVSFIVFRMEKAEEIRNNMVVVGMITPKISVLKGVVGVVFDIGGIGNDPIGAGRFCAGVVVPLGK